jgi:hypothetical protein
MGSDFVEILKRVVLHIESCIAYMIKNALEL